MSSAGWRARAVTALELVDKLMLTISNLALMVILLTICWTVWSRYVLQAPLTWSEDVTSMSFAWFIFIGMAAVHNRRGHVGLDIFTALMSDRAQLFVQRIGDILMVIICGYIAYLCTLQAIVSHGTAHTTVLAIPLSYFFASLALGFGLMAVRSITFILGVPPVADMEEVA